MTLTRPIALVSTLLAAGLALTGCGGTADAGGTTPTPAAAPSTAPAQALTVRDPWVKATEPGVMTAAFATLVNTTGADITVTGATSPSSPLELHTMAMKDGQMVMEPKQGGFVVKANGTHELAPGGDHLMLMRPAAAIAPGDEVEFTLTLGDGTEVPFRAIAKPFTGAQESYDPGHMGQ